jgi:hypothetical protein
MLRTFAVAVGLLGLLAGSAAGEHQIHSRYIVLGYVADAGGKPARPTPVELIRDKTGFSYLGATDSTGFYLIIARLGDESAGEPLTLRVGRAATTITARFDPANHADHRGIRSFPRPATSGHDRCPYPTARAPATRCRPKRSWHARQVPNPSLRGSPSSILAVEPIPSRTQLARISVLQKPVVLYVGR